MGLKPVDLYDIARMCVQSYRITPSMTGWRRIPATEMRFSDLRMYSIPHVNRSAVAWHRPSLASRRAMLAVVIRGDVVHEGMAADAEIVSPLIQAAARWADRNGVRHIVLAGSRDGARLACRVAAGVEFEDKTTVTVVSLGSLGMRRPPLNADLLEIIRDVEKHAESARPEEYLYDIRTLYEAGDLSDMLRDYANHTVIKLPATIRQ